MPELPEVETVRAGLLPLVEGARIINVGLNRADLRFAFPPGFAARLVGRRIEKIDRRGKYLLFWLDGGDLWLAHLGMTGAFHFGAGPDRAGRYYVPSTASIHDHVQIGIEHPNEGPLELFYRDPRRFGFMDLIGRGERNRHIDGMGPEPLGNHFNAKGLSQAFSGRRAPVKALLLDQAIVAGLGNIYVSEALWRARIGPATPGGELAAAQVEALVGAVRAVLMEAIGAGGSTLRDFRHADGASGYFQHRFDVYDREGDPCHRPGCAGAIVRIVQSGRASFYCPVCQGESS